MSDAQNILRNLLHRIAKEQDIQNYELKITPISTEGANYSSLLYLATITSCTHHLDLFIKEAAIKEKMREKCPIKAYEIEIYVYTELKKAYLALEDKHQVPEKHRLFLPKFYGANTKYLEEFLAFEDLAVRGFTTHDRKVSMDWEYAAAAVVELAKLHSLSIAFRKEYPVQFKHFIEGYITDYLTEEFMDAMWKTGFKTTLPVVRQENKEKMKRFLASVDIPWINKMYKPLRCNVLTHGDFRPSNLMHKRKNVRWEFPTDIIAEESARSHEMKIDG